MRINFNIIKLISFIVFLLVLNDLNSFALTENKLIHKKEINSFKIASNSNDKINTQKFSCIDDTINIDNTNTEINNEYFSKGNYLINTYFDSFNNYTVIKIFNIKEKKQKIINIEANFQEGYFNSDITKFIIHTSQGDRFIIDLLSYEAKLEKINLIGKYTDYKEIGSILINEIYNPETNRDEKAMIFYNKNMIQIKTFFPKIPIDNFIELNNNRIIVYTTFESEGNIRGCCKLKLFDLTDYNNPIMSNNIITNEQIFGINVENNILILSDNDFFHLTFLDINSGKILKKIKIDTSDINADYIGHKKFVSMYKNLITIAYEKNGKVDLYNYDSGNKIEKIKNYLYYDEYIHRNEYGNIINSYFDINGNLLMYYNKNMRTKEINVSKFDNKCFKKYLTENPIEKNNKSEFLITNESIGFVKFGMSWQDVINLYKKNDLKIDLINNVLVLSDKKNNKSIIYVSNDNLAEKNYKEKMISYYIGTKSEKYSTKYGVKVGMSIDDLKKIYPNILIYRNLHDKNEFIDINNNISLIVGSNNGEAGIYKYTLEQINKDQNKRFSDNETKKYKPNSRILGIEIRNRD